MSEEERESTMVNPARVDGHAWWCDYLVRKPEPACNCDKPALEPIMNDVGICIDCWNYPCTCDDE